jgi:transcription-repair coupling factor (superfamily II helicase)
MSLSGLLRVITDDPELRRALDEAGSPASPGGDLIAPPALRPFLVAALAG